VNRVEAATSLCITGYYVIHIFHHMFRPGTNIGYTRMLMFACLATIPMVFMLMMIGGRDRWPHLLMQAKEFASNGPLAFMLVAGLAVLVVLMPIGMLVGVWFSMGLGFGSLFVLYFVPMAMRLTFGTTQACILTAVVRGVTFFASFFIAIGIVTILEKFASGAETYERHLHAIWPGYRDAAKMFFGVCVFALINQAIEFWHAITVLLRRGP
jgi:hypothetical protein